MHRGEDFSFASLMFKLTCQQRGKNNNNWVRLHSWFSLKIGYLIIKPLFILDIYKMSNDNIIIHLISIK